MSSQTAGARIMSIPVPDTTDQQLLRIVAREKPATIDEVIDRMNEIDAVLSNDDGLKWVNWLYLLALTQ
jgi:hypothetical protein